MKDIFDPRSYGAVADGHAKDTAAVQGAIDAAAAQGGTVRLAGGTFVCGTLYLKSNVALEITNSATLLASPDIADYGTDTHHNRYRNEPELDRCFLFAQDAENVTICGSGVIDGSAAAFPNAGSIYRPMLLRVLRCRNVRRPIFAILNNRYRPDDLGSSVELDHIPPIGTMARLRFVGITAVDDEGMAHAQRRFDNDIMGEPRFGGCRFDANAAHPIEDVTIRDFWYTAIGGVRLADLPAAPYPEVPDRLQAPTAPGSENYYPN